jgi:carbamoyltransferase
MRRDRYILGISAHYHDSAVTLLKNGFIEFAAQEERFTRVKHDSRFPINAVAAAIDYAQIEIQEIEHVAYYEDPGMRYERVLDSYSRNFPKSISDYLKALSKPAVSKRRLTGEIRRELNYPGQVYFGEHHRSHASSAFFPSNFEESAILTMDGVGEWATSSISFGKGNRITKLAETRYPNSLGLLYSAFTQYCGFKVNSGEYKLMGLAPYGEPKYLDTISSKLAQHDGYGAIKLDMNYFAFDLGKNMINTEFEELFGARAASSDESTQQFYMDIAASIQAFTDEVVLGAARHAREITKSSKLCLAGGVSLNCVTKLCFQRQNCRSWHF